MSQFRYNYVIVGGGIYGVLIAWLLSKQKKNIKILLLEKNKIASGASGGLGQRGVRANGRHIAELPLMPIAYKLWPEIVNEIGLNGHYQQIGGIKLTENPDTLNLLQNIAAKQNGYGVSSHVITDKAILKTMEPAISGSVVGGIYCPYDGVASHELITKTIAKHSQNNGAVIKEYRTVKNINKFGKIWKIEALNNNNNAIESYTVSDSLFLLCNGGVKTILKDSFNINFLQTLEILPQIIVMNRKNQNRNQNKVNHLIGHFERTLALKTLKNNDLMISGGYLGKVNYKTGKGEPIQKNVKDNIKQTKETFNGLNIDDNDETNIIAKTDRFESFCIDKIPIIDRVYTDFEMDCDVFYGFGWCGHGWAISVSVTKLLFQWSQTKTCPLLLRPFSSKRFKGQKLKRPTISKL